MTIALLLGGPRHLDVLSVPDDARPIQVPEVRGIQATWTTDGPQDAGPGDLFNVFTYVPVNARLGGRHHRRVWVPAASGPLAEGDLLGAYLGTLWDGALAVRAGERPSA